MCIRDSHFVALDIGEVVFLSPHKVAGLLVDGFLRAAHEPVSYTHLDVYKRQTIQSVKPHVVALSFVH